MAKIREDLVGSVLVAGEFLFAGDEVPPGGRVSTEMLATEPEPGPEPEPEPDAKPAPKRRPRKKASDAESVD